MHEISSEEERFQVDDLCSFQSINVVQQVTGAGLKVRADRQKCEGIQKKTVTEAKQWNIKGAGDVEEIE